MIDYSGERDFAREVLRELGQEYYASLHSESVGLKDVRLRFLVSTAYYSELPVKEVAAKIKRLYPLVNVHSADKDDFNDDKIFK